MRDTWTRRRSMREKIPVKCLSSSDSDTGQLTWIIILITEKFSLQSCLTKKVYADRIIWVRSRLCEGYNVFTIIMQLNSKWSCCTKSFRPYKLHKLLTFTFLQDTCGVLQTHHVKACHLWGGTICPQLCCSHSSFYICRTTNKWHKVITTLELPYTELLLKEVHHPVWADCAGRQTAPYISKH